MAARWPRDVREMARYGHDMVATWLSVPLHIATNSRRLPYTDLTLTRLVLDTSGRLHDGAWQGSLPGAIDPRLPFGAHLPGIGARLRGVRVRPRAQRHLAASREAHRGGRRVRAAGPPITLSPLHLCSCCSGHSSCRPLSPFHLWHPTRVRPVTPVSAVSSSQELPQEERKRYTQQISHISADLKTVMERREQVQSE